jgi:hypothetical protein
MLTIHPFTVTPSTTLEGGVTIELAGQKYELGDDAASRLVSDPNRARKVCEKLMLTRDVQ